MPAAVLIVGRFMRCLMGYGLAMLQPTFYEQVSSLTGVRFGSRTPPRYPISSRAAIGCEAEVRTEFSATKMCMAASEVQRPFVPLNIQRFELPLSARRRQSALGCNRLKKRVTKNAIGFHSSVQISDACIKSCRIDYFSIKGSVANPFDHGGESISDLPPRYRTPS